MKRQVKRMAIEVNVKIQDLTLSNHTPNIFVYLSNEDSSFHQDATRTFEKLAGEYELWVSRQVLREYAVIMTRLDIIEKPLSSTEVATDLLNLMTQDIKKEPSPFPFQAKNAIKLQLINQKIQDSLKTCLDELKKNMKIQINESLLK